MPGGLYEEQVMGVCSTCSRQPVGVREPPLAGQGKRRELVSDHPDGHVSWGVGSQVGRSVRRRPTGGTGPGGGDDAQCSTPTA